MHDSSRAFSKNGRPTITSKKAGVSYLSYQLLKRVSLSPNNTMAEADRQTETDRQTDRQTETDRETQRDRETHRETQRDTERQKETETQNDTQADRHREREYV